MKTHSPETSTIAISAQARIDDVKKNTFFRCGVFLTLAAAGYFSSYWVIMGLRLLPSLTGAAHDKGNPLLDMLKMLHSGFGG